MTMQDSESSLTPVARKGLDSDSCSALAAHAAETKPLLAVFTAALRTAKATAANTHNPLNNAQAEVGAPYIRARARI